MHKACEEFSIKKIIPKLDWIQIARCVKSVVRSFAAAPASSSNTTLTRFFFTFCPLNTPINQCQTAKEIDFAQRLLKEEEEEGGEEEEAKKKKKGGKSAKKKKGEEKSAKKA